MNLFQKIFIVLAASASFTIFACPSLETISECSIAYPDGYSQKIDLDIQNGEEFVEFQSKSLFSEIIHLDNNERNFAPLGEKFFYKAFCEESSLIINVYEQNKALVIGNDGSAEFVKVGYELKLSESDDKSISINKKYTVNKEPFLSSNFSGTCQ